MVSLEMELGVFLEIETRDWRIGIMAEWRRLSFLSFAVVATIQGWIHGRINGCCFLL